MVRSFPIRAFFVFGLACSLTVGHIECAAAPEPQFAHSGKSSSLYRARLLSDLISPAGRGVVTLIFLRRGATCFLASVAERDPNARWLSGELP